MDYIRKRANNVTDVVDYNEKLLTRNSLYFIKYNSQEELVEEAPKEISDLNQWIYDLKQHEERKPSWYGRNCFTGEQVREKLNQPWERGSRGIQERSDKIITPLKAKIKSPKRKNVWDEYGDEVSISKIFAGNLDTAWKRTVKRERKQKIRKAEIYIQPTGLSSVGDQILFNKAATGLALAKFLDINKVQTRIYLLSLALNCTRGYHGSDIMVLVRLKNYTERFNLDALTLACWSGNFRTNIFYARMSLDQKISRGLGNTVDVNHYPDLLPKVDKYVKRFVVPHTPSVYDGKRYIQSLIAKGDL